MSRMTSDGKWSCTGIEILLGLIPTAGMTLLLMALLMEAERSEGRSR